MGQLSVAWFISWSHRLRLVRHPYDGTRREDVTDGRTRLADGPVRGEPDPSAVGGLPDARLSERGRRRRAGIVGAPQPLRHVGRREPAGMADHGRRAGVLDMLRS